MKHVLFAIALFAATPASAGPAAQRGAEAYRECAACHSKAPDALGPDLDGVVGRKAGSVAGFRYSGPLKRSGIVWTPDRLRAFLIEPQAVIPGNRMPYGGASEQAAADLVAYVVAAPAGKH